MQENITISDLRVNALSEPLGVDTVPVFSWSPCSDGWGKSQTAYRIIVASGLEEYLYTLIAGIRDIQKGYRTFTIKPALISELDSAEAKIKTMRGIVSCGWERASQEKISVSVEIPFGSAAAVKLPANSTHDIKLIRGSGEGVGKKRFENGIVSMTVDSGKYEFMINDK